jgi:hypothetical protein
MISGEFEYHSPSTLEGVVVLFEKHGYGAKILASGPGDSFAAFGPNCGLSCRKNRFATPIP